MHTELKVKENNIDSSGMEAPAEAEAATATGTTFGSITFDHEIFVSLAQCENIGYGSKVEFS